MNGDDADVIRESLTHPQSFGAIFERHVDAVHGYLARRAGRDVADDLTGEVFRAAFEGRGRFQSDRASARPWLYGIAGNLLRRYWRDQRRRRSAYERLRGRGTVDEDPVETAPVRLDAQTQAAGLSDTLAALSRKDREVVLLYSWEGLSYTEIAEALRIPTGTVRSRLNRARRILTKHHALGAANAQLTAADPTTDSG
ncbi:RNA polymerase sigma factor [Egibacter rhizosphaerae]|uniref:RNA polymerase sigma factor n=1 Tax=Egibacter rhizosphaerae TaxID=1670831 RepID=A0A411YCD9_9ACTN|nr:RNA polymerase sigma factor [Egibacter rhizosphaerae]QBI18869.1 RNA polymerase sigma factor [Egibacter rhizosphaerae]